MRPGLSAFAPPPSHAAISRAPAGVAAPRSRPLFGGEDCLSEASSAALNFGTGAKAPEGPRPGAHGFGSFCRNKRTSACGVEPPQAPAFPLSVIPDPIWDPGPLPFACVAAPSHGASHPLPLCLPLAVTVHHVQRVLGHIQPNRRQLFHGRPLLRLDGCSESLHLGTPDAEN